MIPKIEFLYEKKSDETTIFIWSNMRIVDKLTMPEQLTSYTKRKIREELVKKYKDA